MAEIKVLYIYIRMMRINLISTYFLKTAILLLILSKGATLCAQTKLTINQAIETTLKNNLQIKQAEIRERTSGLDYLQSKLNLYPNLNATSSNSIDFGRSLDLTSYTYVTWTFRSH